MFHRVLKPSKYKKQKKNHWVQTTELKKETKQNKINLIYKLTFM